MIKDTEYNTYVKRILACKKKNENKPDEYLFNNSPPVSSGGKLTQSNSKPVKKLTVPPSNSKPVKKVTVPPSNSKPVKKVTVHPSNSKPVKKVTVPPSNSK
jgi:hypothetical protein